MPTPVPGLGVTEIIGLILELELLLAMIETGPVFRSRSLSRSRGEMLLLRLEH